MSDINTILDTLDLPKKINELPENVQQVYKSKKLSNARKKLQKIKKELDRQFEDGEDVQKSKK